MDLESSNEIDQTFILNQHEQMANILFEFINSDKIENKIKGYEYICKLFMENSNNVFLENFIKLNIDDLLIQSIGSNISQIVLGALYLLEFITKPARSNYKICNQLLEKENVIKLLGLKSNKVNNLGTIAVTISKLAANILVNCNQVIMDKINHDKKVMDLMLNSFC